MTVRARKRPLKPVHDAIGYFERHCFDASRLTKRPSLPEFDADWHELTDAERQPFGLHGKPDTAFGTTRPDGQALALATSETAEPDGLVQHRCTLIAIGGELHRMPGRLTAMLDGPGTSKHIGDPDGVPRMPGWRQMLWAGIPQIRSQKWRVFTTDRGGDTWVRVIDPAFYATAEYVVVDLRMREAGLPLGFVQLVYTRRPDRQPRTGR